MALTSEQQRVMDVEYQQHDAFNYPQEALYAAGTALLEYEYHRWIITLSAFRKDLDAHNLHGHYNLFQEHFAEFFPAPVEGAKAEGQAQPLKVAFKRSNRVTANQQAFEDAEYAAPRAESQDNVENLRKSAELCRTLETAMAQLRSQIDALKAPVSDEEWERATDNCPCDGLDTYDYYLAAARTLIGSRAKETL